MQRPASTPTVMSKRKPGTQMFDLQDTALFSGLVGDWFNFTKENHEQTNGFSWSLLDSASCTDKSHAALWKLWFDLLDGQFGLLTLVYSIS